MRFIDLQTQYQGMKEKIDQRIHAVLDHGQYIMGPEVGELEAELAAFVGVKHAVSMSSGTDALLAALMALDIRPGDEVITTAFSFFATAEVILFLGAVPVFVDILPETYNMNPALIAAAITDKTKAIMPVSLYGLSADMNAINAVAAEHGLPVIEDGAQSFGATYFGQRSCGLTTIGCTSFFPSKPLGCYGDGGACFTNDDQLAEAMRQIRVHGQDRRYNHPRLGINGRLDTIQAAVLLEKLAVFPEEIQQRQQVADCYAQYLGDAVITPVAAPGYTSVYAQYTIQVDHRSDVVDGLSAAGVPSAIHYPVPLNKQPAVANSTFRALDLSISDRLSDRVMSLPMHPYLTEEQVQQVAEAVKAQVVAAV